MSVRKFENLLILMQKIHFLLLFMMYKIPIIISFNKTSKITTKSDMEEDQRVVGGRSSHIVKYPFLVSIQKRNSDNQFMVFMKLQYRHLCGGSIISPRWILTAAHCTCEREGKMYDKLDYRIITGLTNIKNPFYSTRLYKVIEMIRHPKYEVVYVYNDIALLKTNVDIRLQHKVSLATLPSKDKFEDIYEPADFYDSCDIAGWGKTSGTAGLSSKLLEVNLPVLKNSQCTRLVLDGAYLKKKQMCTLQPTGGKDACQGDSGGPLICENVVIGIVSWGAGCAEPMKPGIYTRVDKYLKWINKTMIKYEEDPEDVDTEVEGWDWAGIGHRTRGLASKLDATTYIHFTVLSLHFFVQYTI